MKERLQKLAAAVPVVACGRCFVEVAELPALLEREAKLGRTSVSIMIGDVGPEYEAAAAALLQGLEFEFRSEYRERLEADSIADLLAGRCRPVLDHVRVLFVSWGAR